MPDKITILAVNKLAATQLSLTIKIVYLVIIVVKSAVKPIAVLISQYKSIDIGAPISHYYATTHPLLNLFSFGRKNRSCSGFFICKAGA